MMLEQPTAARVTTAALAAKIGLSEAALYRHFASKAQMFEGLFEFIEATIFGLINQIQAAEPSALERLRQTTGMLLSFAKRNRGMTRVLTGDALVNEDLRLQERVNQITGRLETTFKQVIREGIATGQISATVDVVTIASLLTHYVMGRWLRFTQSGWQVDPTDNMLANINIVMQAALVDS
jgi:TetR/AcrR family transcriptional regulator